ncbi:MAG: HAMP domain-containing histidine kinase [Myxococcales bacterium]|nr:HAMP domain-containing histidine kinase [Myxococcales bacterium]
MAPERHGYPELPSARTAATLTVVAAATFAVATGASPWPLPATAGGLSLIGTLVLSYLRRARPSLARSALGPSLLIDLALLTCVLVVSGGASTPLSPLYVVFPAVAAVVLGRAWAWTLVVFGGLGYGVLFLLSPSHDAHHHGGFGDHLRGMVVAYAVSAILIAYFVTRLANQLRAREALLRTIQSRVERSERVAAMTSLAAAAAHELGTPLGTIAVAASELQLALGDDSPPAWRKDAQLIGDEARRCRDILLRIGEQAGASAGENSERISLDALTRSAVDSLNSNLRGRVIIDASPEVFVHVPPRALSQALGALLTNGMEASTAGDRVYLRARTEADRVLFEIEDAGSGMDPSTLAQATEPFFSTKGEGRGLGLFLVRELAERLGGSLAFEPLDPTGTRAILQVPR